MCMIVPRFSALPDQLEKVTMGSFRVLQIDHVEFFVPDRHEAARWYQQVLGLEIVPEYEDWADTPGGPLMISSDRGRTKLALFQGEPQASRPAAGFHRVAFRVDSGGFMQFLQGLEANEVKNSEDRPVTVDSVVDHQKAYSIYFTDPYGHHLEITTYDHEATQAALTELRRLSERM